MSKSQSIIILLCLAIMIGVGVDHVQAQARPKATAADVWAVTQEDDNTAILTFLSTTGDNTAKVRAAVRVDRERVKARVGEAPATVVKPRWIYVDNRNENGALIGKTLVDLSVITKYDIPIGSSDVLLYEGGFVTVRTPATPEIKAFLNQHFGATDLSTQAVPAAEARTK